MDRYPIMLLMLLAPLSAALANSYDEALSGDLSDERLAPTPLLLGAGDNVLRGTFGAGAAIFQLDLDYATITIPAGLQLEAFIVAEADVGGAFSFIGLQAGPQITVPYTTVDAGPLLGWAHYGSADQGQDILPVIATGPGAIGFAPPLGPGVYSLWLMELDTSRRHNYTFNLRVSAIPEPATAAMLLLCPIMLRRRRR